MVSHNLKGIIVKKRANIMAGMLIVLLMASGYVSAQCCSPAPETKAATAATACNAQAGACPKQGSCAGCPVGIMKNAKALGLTEAQAKKIQRIMERAFEKVQAQLTDAQQAKAQMICGKGGCPLSGTGCKKACCATKVKAKACAPGCTKPCCAAKAEACAAAATKCGPSCTKPCCATKVKAKACAPGCTKPCCAAKAKACCAAAAVKCGPSCTKPCCATKVKAKACAPGCTKPCCAAKAKACCAAAAATKCGPNCTKPCCATKVKAKACAPSCTKPCCAAKDLPKSEG